MPDANPHMWRPENINSKQLTKIWTFYDFIWHNNQIDIESVPKDATKKQRLSSEVKVWRDKLKFVVCYLVPNYFKVYT